MEVRLPQSQHSHQGDTTSHSYEHDSNAKKSTVMTNFHQPLIPLQPRLAKGRGGQGQGQGQGQNHLHVTKDLPYSPSKKIGNSSSSAFDSSPTNPFSSSFWYTSSIAKKKKASLLNGPLSRNNHSLSSAASSCSMTSTGASTTCTSADAKSNTAVYVRDSAYGWLPAIIQTISQRDIFAGIRKNDNAHITRGPIYGNTNGNDLNKYNLYDNSASNQSLDGIRNEQTELRVKIVLPDDWAQTTVLSDNSTVQELEYRPTTQPHGMHQNIHGIHSQGTESTRPGTPIGITPRQFRPVGQYKYEREAGLFASHNNNTIPGGVHRTVSLDDYPNNQLPLQNLQIETTASRMALRRRASLSNSSIDTNSTFHHPIHVVSDMADLPYLHEAAVLYNLKARHKMGLPYTRVGDIVVSVNPFAWKEGLYGSIVGVQFAKHLIWDLKDVSEEECDDNEHASTPAATTRRFRPIEDGTHSTASSSSMSTSRSRNTDTSDASSFLPPLPSSNRNESHTHQPLVTGSAYSRIGMEPHVYEISCLAYRGLAANRKNQTILVSGESGAGKTEAVKIVMGHLAGLEKTRPFYHDPSTGQNNKDSMETIASAMNMGGMNAVRAIISELATTATNTFTGNSTQSSPMQRVEEHGHIVGKVLKSNPLFEAFGNAKTMRNDNSSRFGRFTQLQFELESPAEARHRKMLSSRSGKKELPKCLLAGSHCTTYLLEKSRVVGQSPGERSYHVFYQLLSAPECDRAFIWKEGLTTQNNSHDNFVVEDGDHISTLSEMTTDTISISSILDHKIYNQDSYPCDGFRYLNGTKPGSNEREAGMDDSKEWEATVQALSIFGFTKENNALRDLMRALCVVLQLGNLTFANEEEIAVCDARLQAAVSGGGSVITSTKELEKTAGLMGIPVEDIRKAMTMRVNCIRGEEVVIKLSSLEAAEGCDALAKEIYAQMFDLLVCEINGFTSVEHLNNSHKHQSGQSKHFGTISLLDIFGFERFDVNQFEQLCINYANERLQQRYVLDNFQAVQEEYVTEGIEIFDFETVNNADVLNIIEGKLGVISTINEECIRPNGSDEEFVFKIKKKYAKFQHLLLSDALHQKHEFGIKHFAGPVTYEAKNFLKKNSDSIPLDLLECASKSENVLIRTQFEILLNKYIQEKKSMPTRTMTASKRTVLAKFQRQLHVLMDNIENTKTRYIRCIKPNHDMLPELMNHWETIYQLESAGLVTAITISRESFPNRLAYDVTWERFNCLLDNKDIYFFKGTLRVEVEKLLAILLSKPYIRSDGKEVLSYACGKTKVYFRAGSLERLETERMAFYSTHATSIQKWFRREIMFCKYTLLKYAIIQLQANIRRKSTSTSFGLQRRSAIILQTFARFIIARNTFVCVRNNKNVTSIQSWWRMKREIGLYRKVMLSTITIQRSIQLFLFKQKQQKLKLRNVELKESTRKDQTLKQYEIDLATLREENQTLRRENIELKEEIKDSTFEQEELSRIQLCRERELQHKHEIDLNISHNELETLQNENKSLRDEVQILNIQIEKDVDDTIENANLNRIQSENLQLLEVENGNLKHCIKNLESEKHNLLHHTQSYVTEINDSKNNVNALQNQNTALVTELTSLKQEVVNLKTSISHKDEIHEAEMMNIEEKFRKDTILHEEENKDLKSLLDLKTKELKLALEKMNEDFNRSNGIHVVQKENEKLKAYIKALELEKQDLLHHTQSIEAEADVSRKRLHHLQNQNTTLVTEVITLKQDVVHLEDSICDKDEAHQTEIKNIVENSKNSISAYEQEIENLKALHESKRKENFLERKRLIDQMEKEKDDYRSEIVMIRNNQSRTKGGQDEYLAKLMDVLETRNSEREKETKKLNQKLQEMKQSKNDATRTLQQKFKLLNESINFERQDIIRKVKIHLEVLKKESNKKHQRLSQFMSHHSQTLNYIEDSFVSKSNFKNKHHSSLSSNGSGRSFDIQEQKNHVNSMQKIYLMGEKVNQDVGDLTQTVLDDVLLVLNENSPNNLSIPKVNRNHVRFLSDVQSSGNIGETFCHSCGAKLEREI